jgi:hypothetical protein
MAPQYGARVSTGVPHPARRRVFALATTAIAVDTLMFSAIVPALPEYQREMGLSDTGVALVFAAFPVAQLLVALLLPRWVDRAGRRRAIALGAVLRRLLRLQAAARRLERTLEQAPRGEQLTLVAGEVPGAQPLIRPLERRERPLEQHPRVTLDIGRVRRTDALVVREGALDTDVEQLAQRAAERPVERGALPHDDGHTCELRDARLRILEEQRLDVEDGVSDRQHLHVPTDDVGAIT